MKAPLILIVSKKMDSNQKDGRYEDRLIRMGVKARKYLGLANEKTVEIWPDTDTQERISRNRALEIFQAYSSDLKEAIKSMPEKDYERIGFVTSKTFDYICKDSRRKKANIWLADTIEDTVVGGDPEFILTDADGHVQYAAEIMGHGDSLGSDGPLAELRPEPAVSVEKFVDNIMDLLRDHPNVATIEPYNWLAACWLERERVGGSQHTWSIGGHIHLGTPARLSSLLDHNNQGNSYHSAAVFRCLQKAIDEYVAIPMIKVDGVNNTIKRRMEYGKYGGSRIECGRLEYRSLSGEWLSHPKMAKAVVGTVKAISHEFFRIFEESDFDIKMVTTSAHRNRSVDAFNTNFNAWKDIEIMQELGATKGSIEMKKILHEGEFNFTKSYFTGLKNALRRLSTYRDYMDNINMFIEIVSLSKRDLEGMNRDLKHNWQGNANFII